MFTNCPPLHLYRSSEDASLRLSFIDPLFERDVVFVLGADGSVSIAIQPAADEDGTPDFLVPVDLVSGLRAIAAHWIVED